jgi:plastocyanin
MGYARVLMCALLMLAVLFLNGHASTSAPPSRIPIAKVAVAIENYAFQPDTISIALGATVVWTNRDEVAHTVVSSDKLFSSPELDVNQSFEYTFKKAGEFAYFCSIHPEMKGKVFVK